MNSEMVTNILTAFQLFINFATICTLLYTLVRFTQKPTENLKSRVDELETWKTEVDRRLDNGNDRFNAYDEGNAVIQQALLAIMDAIISGDNVEELKKARTELYEYNTRRRKRD